MIFDTDNFKTIGNAMQLVNGFREFCEYQEFNLRVHPTKFRNSILFSSEGLVRPKYLIGCITDEAIIAKNTLLNVSELYIILTPNQFTVHDLELEKMYINECEEHAIIELPKGILIMDFYKKIAEYCLNIKN